MTIWLKCAPDTAPNIRIRPIERSGRCRGVLEQLKSNVVRREAAGHDAGANHRDDQEPRPKRLGDEASRQLDRDLPGTGLGDWSSELGHAAPATAAMRWRSSATVASNAAAGADGDGVGDRPVQPTGLGLQLLTSHHIEIDHPDVVIGAVVGRLP